MNQANIKIVMGSKPVSDGRHLVYIRITKNRRKKEISLGIRGMKENFVGEQFVKKHKSHKIDNELLFVQKKKAYEIVRKFQIDSINFSLEDFEDVFRGKEEQKDNVMMFFDEIISEMVASSRMGNARAYEEAKISLKRFMKDKSYRIVKFKDLDPEVLEKFEVYMRSRGNQNGGIALKMRQIRALFNKAIERGIHYIGIDTSNAMLEKALEFSRENCFKIRDSFDFVTDFKNVNEDYFRDSFSSPHTVVLNFSYLLSNLNLEQVLDLATQLENFVSKYPLNYYLIVFQNPVNRDQNFRKFIANFKSMKKVVLSKNAVVHYKNKEQDWYAKNENFMYEIITN